MLDQQSGEVPRSQVAHVLGRNLVFEVLIVPVVDMRQTLDLRSGDKPCLSVGPSGMRK